MRIDRYHLHSSLASHSLSPPRRWRPRSELPFAAAATSPRRALFVSIAFCLAVFMLLPGATTAARDDGFAAWLMQRNPNSGCAVVPPGAPVAPSSPAQRYSCL